MQVTDAMVYAAKKQMAAAWGEEHIRAALKAALDEAYVDEQGAHGLGGATGSVTAIACQHPDHSVGGPIEPTFAAAELLDTDEIADRFGVPKATVTAWARARASNSFPRPVKQRKAAQLFQLGAVQAWHEAQQAAGDG
jgi:predicted DNA-binding transcriptional regulator AlpA